MKFLCPACERLVEIAAFRVDGTALVLRCEKCGVESRASVAAGESPSALAEAPRAAAVPEAPRAAPAPSEPPAPSAPSNVVPLRPVAGGLSTPPAPEAQPPREDEWLQVPEGRCPKCVAAVRPGARACPQCGLVFANFKPEEHRPSTLLLASWLELTLAWEKPEAHERFVKDALLRQELVPAGRLYRIRLARAPDDPMAAHGRDVMLKVAAGPEQLASQRDQGMSTAVRRGRAIALSLVLAVLVVLIIGLARRLLGASP